MKTKQILIAGGIIVVAAFSLPYLTNTDFFRGALIGSDANQGCTINGEDFDGEFIQLTAGDNPRYIYQDTHELDDGRTIPVYKDLPANDRDGCIGNGAE